MTERGALAGQGATACPFVAFDDDRDRRAAQPDPRHRCYAEVDPQPRSIPHQQSFCVSSNFPSCPIFQGWAARAAAREVPGRDDRTTDIRRVASVEAGAAPSVPTADPVPSAPPGLTPLTPPAEPPMPSRTQSDRAWAAPPPWTGDAGASPVEPPSSPPPAVDRAVATTRRRDPLEDTSYSYSAHPRPQPTLEGDPAPPPPFLAGREGPSRPVGRSDPVDGAAPPRSQAHRAPIAPPLRSDRAAPDWERPRRFEAYPTLKTRSGLSHVPRVAFLAAALAIAALLLFLAPQFLPGGDGRPGTGGGTSPRATVGGGDASAAASGTPAPTPTSAPTPQTYTVAEGDTLGRIARRFGLTTEQLLAANPQITDANRIRIGDVLNIPDDTFTPPPPTDGDAVDEETSAPTPEG